MTDKAYIIINCLVGAIGFFATLLVTYPLGTMQPVLAFEIVGTVAYAFLFVLDMFVVIARKKVYISELTVVAVILILGLTLALRLLSTLTKCNAWPMC